MRLYLVFRCSLLFLHGRYDSAAVVAGGLLITKSMCRCEASSFGLMLRSPKRDIPKTLHKILQDSHDQLRFTFRGSSSPAPALHGWSSLCKAAKSKEIYAPPTDASRPKELTSHRYTFCIPIDISITSCLQLKLHELHTRTVIFCLSKSSDTTTIHLQKLCYCLDLRLM